MADKRKVFHGMLTPAAPRKSLGAMLMLLARLDSSFDCSLAQDCSQREARKTFELVELSKT
jgi:hypothetical protein